ncbi:MAG: SIMPL domain-containing protein, partial [Actinobacteria bacterium]|nr:SIMPL domain-containing protein [Actinomycetota bacterium]
MEKNNKIIYFGIIVGICFIIGIMIFSYAFYKVRTADNSMWVTGSFKQKVSSDISKLSAGFSRNVPVEDLKSGYSQMKSDEEIVKKFFIEAGFNEKDLQISPVYMDAPFLYDPNAAKEYILRQTVEIQSKEIQKLTDLSKNVQKLIDEGVIFSINNLQYYVTNLPQLRINLLADAVKDAKARAQKIAEGTGKKIGTIKTANMGVVQVLPVNSTDVSDYG